MRPAPPSVIAVGRAAAFVALLWYCIAVPLAPPAGGLGPQGTPPRTAILRVRAVALLLGPADQLEGERAIQGLVVSLFPPGAATGAAPDAGAPDAGSALPPGAAGEVAGPSGTTDSGGNVLLAVPPGAYRVCADSESLASPPSRVSLCEEVTLAAGETTRLLVRHSPQSDFLTFSWMREGEGVPPAR